jgi:hypothetical protein
MFDNNRDNNFGRIWILVEESSISKHNKEKYLLYNQQIGLAIYKLLNIHGNSKKLSFESSHEFEFKSLTQDSVLIKP